MLDDQDTIAAPRPRGFARSASSMIDEFFSPVSQPLGEAAGHLAGSVTGMFAPQYQEPVERGVAAGVRALPRTAGEFLLTRGRSPLLKAAGYGDVALRSFADTPPEASMAAKLGSTALQTAAFEAAPRIGGGLGRAGAEALAPGSTLARRVGSAAGTVGGFELSNYASTHMLGTTYDPLTPEHIASTAASVLPFEAGQIWFEHLQTKQKADGHFTQQREYQPTDFLEAPLKNQPSVTVESPETLTAAGYMTPEGNVELGSNHPSILKRLGISGFDSRESRNTPDFGFMTNKGRFVTRQEATKLAQASGQAFGPLEEGHLLHSDELSLEPGGTQSMAMGDLPQRKGMAQPSVTFNLKQPLTPKDQEMINEWQRRGLGGKDLETLVQAMKGYQRSPGKSWARAVTEAMFPQGIGEGGLLAGTKKYADYFFNNVLGLPKADSDRLTQNLLRIAAMVGGLQLDTDVVGATGAGFYTTHPSDFVKSVIGILDPQTLTVDQRIAHVPANMAHELFHGFDSDLERNAQNSRISKATYDAWMRAREVVSDLTKDEMYEGVDVLGRLLTAKWDKSEWHMRRAQVYAETPQGRREYLMDVMSGYAMGLTTKRDSRPFQTVKDLLQFGEANTNEIARGMYADFGKSLGILHDVGKELGYSKRSMDKLNELYNNFKALEHVQRNVDHQTAAFLAMQEAKTATPMTPIERFPYDKVMKWQRYLYLGDLDKDIMDFVEKVSPMVMPQKGVELPKELGIRMNLFQRMFIAGPQLKNWIPQLADMQYLGRSYGALAHEFVNTVESMFKDPTTNKIDTQKMAELVKDGSPLNVAWNKVSLLENDMRNSMSRGDRNKIPEYGKLADDDKAYLDQMFDHKGQAMNWVAMKLYDSFKNVLGLKVARGLMSYDSTLKYQEAQKIGDALVTMHMDQDIMQVNPQDFKPAHEDLWRSKQKAQLVLQEYMNRGRIQQDAVNGLAKTFEPFDPVTGKPNKILEKARAYREDLLGKFSLQGGAWGFEGKPWFSPEVRLGEWLLAWQEKDAAGKPVGEPNLVGFKDKKAFQARFDALNKQWTEGKLLFLVPHNRTDLQDVHAGMNPEKFRIYNDVMMDANNKIISLLQRGNPELAQQIATEMQSEMTPMRGLQSILESPYMREERVGGRESLNMAEGLIHYVANIGYTIAKRYETGQHALYLQDPIMRPHPNLQKYARMYFNEITDPTERGFTSAIRKLTALNYIFFSPSLALVELTQQFTNHIPALINATNSILKPWNEVVQANIDMANATIGSKGGKHLYFDPRDTAAVEKAVKMGLVDRGWLQEFWPAAHDLEFINKKRLFGGKFSPLDRSNLLGNSIYQLYRLGTNLHGMAITWNTEVAFLSAMRTFRKAGLSEEEAFRKSFDLVGESMHGGGRASRPLWYLGVGPHTLGANVGGVMYSLQSYVYNTVGQMAHYLWTAGKNTAKNPAELSAAHKAAASMIGASLVLSGIGGIPITNQMIALIEQRFPNVELRRRIKEMFFGAGKWINSKTHLMGQDEEMGRFLATAGTDGLTSTMTPWNMGNRFELGMLLGVDPYRGFSWANVVGPSGPMLEDLMTKPFQAAAKGHYEDMLTSLIPNNPIKRLAQLATHGFDLRNTDYRLNLQLDNFEKASLAAGFTPKRVAEEREFDALKRRAEAVHALEQKKFHEGLAVGMVDNSMTPADVQRQLIIHARETPGYNPREGARRVAELIQSMTLPYDPLRTGSPQARAFEMGQMFDLGALEREKHITEVKRLLDQHEMQQTFGFPTPIGEHEMMTAQLVDNLMQQNPTMSRSEAQSMLMYALHPRTAMYQHWPVPAAQ